MGWECVRTRRPHVVVAAGLSVLVAVAVAEHLGPSDAGLVAGPVGAAVLIRLARWAGLSWAELGLSGVSLKRGARYAVGAAALVAFGYTVAVAVPGIRAGLLDTRYLGHPVHLLLVALVAVPLATVLFEEVAFRGVLWAAVRRDHGTAWATVVSATLFGLWHVLSSLGLARANQGVGATLGAGSRGQLLTVASVVVFTGLAGVVLCELRRRSGSLIAPIGLHWASNGLGVLFSAAAWAVNAGTEER